MGGIPFISLDETQEQHVGHCESACQMLGRAFALFLVGQWGVSSLLLVCLFVYLFVCSFVFIMGVT